MYDTVAMPASIRLSSPAKLVSLILAIEMKFIYLLLVIHLLRKSIYAIIARS